MQADRRRTGRKIDREKNNAGKGTRNKCEDGEI